MTGRVVADFLPWVRDCNWTTEVPGMYLLVGTTEGGQTWTQRWIASMSDDATHEEGQGEELFEHHRLVADLGKRPPRRQVHHQLGGAPVENKLQTAAKSGYVRVNGEPVKSNHKVKPGDVVTVELRNLCLSLSCDPWTWTSSTRTTTFWCSTSR